jgi:2,3-bisphosphoglycerate-dependent phosphoglycerate mutase
VAKLVLLRHGESVWNQKNLFTGWVDIPLSSKGIDEAFKAGERIADIPFQAIYVSTLMRAQLTAMLAMSRSHGECVPCMIHEHDAQFMKMAGVYNSKSERMLLPVYAYSELNERMYGELQGLNKEETLKKHGEAQFTLWRRSYRGRPPGGESLEMTAKRAIPFFQKKIVPHLEKGENILISAHGNSLRAIVMFLEQLSEEEVVQLELPTGEPRVYDFHKPNFWKREHLDSCREGVKKQL